MVFRYQHLSSVVSSQQQYLSVVLWQRVCACTAGRVAYLYEITNFFNISIPAHTRTCAKERDTQLNENRLTDNIDIVLSL